MTKLLKLEVTYDGAYAYLNEYMIIPAEVNGVLFEKLPLDKVLENTVELDGIGYGDNTVELDGIGYGDLVVTEIDSDELDPIELKELIENQSVEHFEIFSDSIESQFENKEGFDKQKVESLLEKYNLEKCYISTTGISLKICETLKEKMPDLTSLNIKNSELEKVLEILEKHGIKVYSTTTL